MAFFETIDGLNREAKAFALKKFRALVQSYQNGKNPLDGASEPELRTLSGKWESALRELNDLLAAQPGVDDAEAWDDLFADGKLDQWEDRYRDSLIPVQEAAGSYQGGTMTDRLTNTVEVKKWDLGSMLCEMQGDFSEIVLTAQSYGAEMKSANPTVSPYDEIEYELKRDIVFNPEERLKREREEEENNTPKKRFSEAAIINFAKIENYAEFEETYRKNAPLSQQLDSLTRTRQQEIEKNLPNKGYIDHKKEVENYIEPRMQYLRNALADTMGNPEMQAIEEAKRNLSLAEEDVQTRRQEAENAQNEFNVAEDAMKKEIERIEREYGEGFAALDQKIRENFQKLNEVDENGKNAYQEKHVRERMKDVNEMIANKEREIESLEKNGARPDEEWLQEQQRKIKSSQDGIRATLPDRTREYGEIRNDAELDEAIRAEEEKAFKEALSNWENTVDELKDTLLQQEQKETVRVGKELAGQIRELTEEKDDLAEKLSTQKENKADTLEEMEKCRDEYNALKADEKIRTEIIQSRLEVFANQKAALFQEWENEQQANRGKSIKGFPEGEWRDLLEATKEGYARNAPAFRAAETARELAEQIEKGAAEENELGLSGMTLADYRNPEKLGFLRRGYCAKFDEKLREEKGKEFDSKVNIRRGNFEKLASLTNAAYKLYTKIDENLDDRFVGRKTFAEKYGRITTKEAPNENEINSNAKYNEGRTLAELKTDILKYRDNAETLMYGARVYQIKKQKDESNLERWTSQLDTPASRKLLESINAITDLQNDMLDKFDSKQRRQAELEANIGNLANELKQEDEKIGSLTSQLSAKETELAEKSEQMKNMEAWWKQTIAGEAEDVSASAEKLAAFGGNDPAVQENAQKLKDLLAVKPQVGKVSSPKLDALKNIKTAFNKELSDAEQEIRKESLADYVQRKKNELNAYKEANSEQKIRENVRGLMDAEKANLQVEKERMNERKTAELNEAGKDLLKAQENLDGATKRLEESENACKKRGDELGECEKKYETVLKKHESIEKLIQLYGKEVYLIQNSLEVAEDVKGRAAVVKSVEEMKEQYNAASQRENDRLNTLKESLPEKMLRPTANRLLDGVDNFLQTADVGRADKNKENSKEYKDMNGALAAYARKARENALDTPDKMIEELRKVKEQAQKYTEAKTTAWYRKVFGYYSNQATVRLDYAKRVMEFCDKGIEKLNAIPQQVNEMQQSVEGNLRGTYADTAEFFGGFVKQTLNAREDVGQLSMDKEYAARTGVAKLLLQENRQKMSPQEFDMESKQLDFSLNKKLEENKGPFAFRTFDDKADLQQWINDYKALDVKRSELEKTAGIAEKFKAEAPVQKNAGQKNVEKQPEKDFAVPNL